MHLIWLRLIKTRLLHHKWFSESFDGSAATSGVASQKFGTSQNA